MAATDPESFTGTDRFQVQKRLGAGSFGVVYDVLDRDRNTRVALKTLRAGGGRTLYRFKQEFRALADVSHPNLVTLYELLAEGEQWFFTMERIEGVTFLEHVRGGPEPWGLSSSGFSLPTTPEVEAFLRGDSSGEGARLAAVPSVPVSGSPGGFAVDRLRAALAQLAEGVSALHAAGKLHRDIKPSNVLVTTEGRVVVLDFGLIRELRTAITHSLDTVGTPAYMSPEQATESPLSESSDWYSVGVMLYESLTGTLPFSGPALEVMRRKQLDEPPPPSTLVPDVPEDLDLLCRSLLRRAPAQRPSGWEVRQRLRGQGAPAVEVAAAPAAPAGGPAVPFVGRASELARLREAYAIVRSGHPITVSVHGGSGMGKTALVRRFLDELRLQRPAPVILSGRCYERESVPYKAFDSVVDALSQHLRRLGPGPVEALLPHDVLALVRLFPVLRQVPGVARARRTVLEIPDSQELRRRAFGALRELFVRLADRCPVAVVMDDLQWGDVDSAALLTDLMKPPDSPALLLIGCYRTEEATTSPLLTVLLPLRESPAAAALGKMDLAVGELGPDEARALASEILGPEPRKAARAEAIARESQGNPFLVDALSRFGAGEPSGALDDLILRRAAELPEPARRLLDVVSIAGRPIELGVAFQAAGLDHEGDAALAVLRGVHFVRTRRSGAWDEVEPYHDRIRDAVISGLDAEEARRAHERLATSLLAAGRLDPERLAEHFREAGQVQEAADYAAAAADAAADALAFDRAARLYRLSLGLRPEQRAEEHRRRLRLGDALANAGRGREAADAYLAALEGTGPAERIDLHRRAAQQLLMAGHLDEGYRLVGTVLASLGISMPGSTRSALVSLMLRRAVLRVRGLWFRRRDEARVPAWELLRIDTCFSIAVGLGLIDLVRAAAFQARSLHLALRGGEPYRVARGLALEALFVGVGGGVRSRARVDRLLAAANGLAKELGHEHALGLAALADGVAAWVQGRWKDARRLCDEAAAILRERCVGATWESDNAEMYALASLFMLGEITEFSRRLPRLLERAEDRGNLMTATQLRVGFFSHVAWLAADDPEGARREIEVGLAASSEKIFDFRQIWVRGARRDIALYTGVGLEAAAPVPASWRLAARTLDRFPQAALILGMYSRARRRVALAAAATTPALAESDLQQAGRHVRELQRQKTPWGDALALLVRAGVSVTRGQRDRALAEVTDAEGHLAAVDMALHAAAARRRRGETMGGEAGHALVAEADAWMAGQSIRRPDRMARMLVPGAFQRIVDQ